MHRPVRIIAPATLPVSLEDVKHALRIDHDEDDTLVEAAIRAAVDHYEGWSGILGICLVEQTWQQYYDRLDRSLCLPLGPVIEIMSATFRNQGGQISTIDDDDYSLDTDAGGRSFLRFRSGYSLTGDLYDHRAVSVTYRAGWRPENGRSTVPADIQAAIKIRAQIALDEAALGGSEHLERIERDLIGKYRRWIF